MEHASAAVAKDWRWEAGMWEAMVREGRRREGARLSVVPLGTALTQGFLKWTRRVKLRD
jgi:hypothetical protein